MYRFDKIKSHWLNTHFLFFHNLFLSDHFSFFKHCFYFFINDVTKHLSWKFKRNFKQFAKSNFNRSIQYLLNDVNEIRLFFKHLNEFFKSIEDFKCFERDFNFDLFNSLILRCTRFWINFDDHFNHFDIVNWDCLLNKIHSIEINIISNVFDCR